MSTSWFELNGDPPDDDPWAAFNGDADDTRYRAVPVPPPEGYTDPGVGVDEALDAFVRPEDLTPVDPAEINRQHVTAILVAHNGARWLSTAIDAVLSSVRPVDHLVAVDTGSRDDTHRILSASLGAESVLRVRHKTGFGAAVSEGIRFADRARNRGREREGAAVGDRGGRSGRRRGAAATDEWIWLLHDDSAPEPDALLRLLEAAIRNPRAGVVGPKVLGWRERRLLLEVGLTVTRGGRRETGLERREFDQGQHDRTREVLAVGSAGMLVRRDVWDQLGGFDRFLPIFRDDLDFGWRANLAGHDVVVCPDAVVHHVEAAAHGRRRIRAARGRPHLIDRRHALYVLLVNAPLRRFVFVLLRAILGSLVRALGYLVGKQPALAFEEIVALVAVLLRPDRMIRGRLARRSIRAVPDSDLAHLFPPRGQQLRQGLETIYGILSGTGSGHDLPGQRRHAADTGPDDDGAEPQPTESMMHRVATQPGIALVFGLALVALLAARSLIGNGRLMGGALLPAPNDASAVWDTYLTSWHGVGLGSATASPPYLAVVALFGSILGGNVSLAVDLLLIGSVPLAALTAYLALRRLVENPWVRVWAAGTYGLLPATTGAIAAGRLGTSVAIILTPLVAVAALRSLGRPAEPGPTRVAWSAGLLLAVTAAFVPLAWVAAVLLALLGLFTVYRGRARALRLLIILGLTPVLLLPWTGQVLQHPVLLVSEPGIPGPGLSDANLPPWALLLQHPGGPGSAPVWLGLGVLLAGYAVLARRDRRPLIVAGWIVAFVGFLLGLLVLHAAVTAPTVQTPVAGWPGYAAALVGMGLLIAAAVGADGARSRLRARRLPAPQRLLAAGVALAAAATPVLGVGWWVYRGADDPLDRRDPHVLPAYVVDEASRPERVRTLVMRPTGDGPVAYALLRSGGPRLGDAETGPEAEARTALDELVGDLVSGRGSARASELAAFAIRYVYLPAPADRAATDALDAVPGLTRASAPPGAAIWRVEATVARMRVLPPEGGGEILALPSGVVTADTEVPEGPEGRTLVLAENADPGWDATLDGTPLRPMAVDGWAQGFELPAQGGQLNVRHEGPERSRWLLFQLLAVGAAFVLALPAMRRESTDPDEALEADLVDTGETPVPVPSSDYTPRRARRPTPQVTPVQPGPPSRETAVPVGPRSEQPPADEDTVETSLTWFIPEEALAEPDPAALAPAGAVDPEPASLEEAPSGRPKGGRRARRGGPPPEQPDDRRANTGGARARGRRVKGRKPDRDGER